MNPSIEYLSTGQVADELGIAVSTVDKYTSLGLLTPIGQVGGRRVWSSSQVEEARKALAAAGRSGRRHLAAERLAS